MRPSGEGVSVCYEASGRRCRRQAESHVAVATSQPLALLSTVSHLLPKGMQQPVPWGEPFSYVNRTAIRGGRFHQYPCFTRGYTEPHKVKQ